MVNTVYLIYYDYLIVRNKYMKALVIEAVHYENSTHTECLNTLTAELDRMDWDAEVVSAADMHIEHCVGCGNCTYKTPGICSFRDDMQSLYPKIIQADLLLTFSPVPVSYTHLTLPTN